MTLTLDVFDTELLRTHGGNSNGLKQLVKFPS